MAEISLLSYLGRTLRKGPNVGQMQYGEVWSLDEDRVGVKWFPVGEAVHVTYSQDTLDSLNRRECKVIPRHALPLALLPKLKVSSQASVA